MSQNKKNTTTGKWHNKKFMNARLNYVTPMIEPAILKSVVSHLLYVIPYKPALIHNS